MADKKNSSSSPPNSGCFRPARLSSIIACLALLLLASPPSFGEEKKEPVALEPVVVTASGIEEPLDAVSVSVEVITEKDMRERQAERVDEALRGISGVKISSYGGADPWAWGSIRGSDYDQVLVLVDGVEINNPYDLRGI